MTLRLSLALLAGLYGCAAGVEEPSGAAAAGPGADGAHVDGGDGDSTAGGATDDDSPDASDNGGADGSTDGAVDDGTEDPSDGCDPGLADCDGDASNGCERNTDELGPCLPADNCTPLVHDGRQYYFCPDALGWDDARAACQLQTGGDLVQIDDKAEDDFVIATISANSWVGGSDSNAEGQWFWLPDSGPQFWSGDANGAPVTSAYTNWGSGEPNDAGDQDCQLASKENAVWDDQSCSLQLAYVCEVAAP